MIQQNKGNYTQKQLNQMKKRAISEANKMYQKSTNYNKNTSKKNQNNNINHNTDKYYENNKNQTDTKHNFPFDIDNILKNFNIERDTALIFILIYILSKDKKNYKLILALLYLII